MIIDALYYIRTQRHTQTDRHTHTETGRQTDRHTDIHTHTTHTGKKRADVPILARTFLRTRARSDTEACTDEEHEYLYVTAQGDVGRERGEGR